MKIKQFNYQQGKGWSVNKFPDLDDVNTLVIVFGAPVYQQQQKVIDELRAHYPTSKFIGCSSSGEIFGNQIFDDSLSVAVVNFEKTQLRVCSIDIEDANESGFAGEKIGKTLAADDLRSILVLSDGLNVNGTDLVIGLKRNVTEGVIVSGGLAGDGNQFNKTWVLDGTIKSNSINAVGFYGEHIHVSCGSKGGWDIFGLERVITKSKGNVLYEIDDQPALDLYKKYLGDRARGLPATALLFPLAIRENSEEEPVVRTVLSIDEKSKSMTFAGDMPEHWQSQFMQADFNRLIEGASEAGRIANNALPADGDNILAVAISCVGRRLVLGERSEEEVDAIIDVLPKDTHIIGYYSYGEISPSGIKNCDLHNQTMTITTMFEK